MTDKDYIEYAKAIHEEVYAMSTPMIDGMAGKVLTRIRKEQKKLFKMPEAWTSVLSNIIDVVDVMSVHAHKGRIWSEMNKGLEKILDQYIIDRYNELEAKHHLMLKSVVAIQLMDQEQPHGQSLKLQPLVLHQSHQLLVRPFEQITIIYL